MTLLALGLNHNTASVALREKVAFSPDGIGEALKSLISGATAEEAVILSTCNRTELYCKVNQPDAEGVIEWLQAFHGVAAEDIRPCLYTYQGEEAVQHLMRVACGLDSLVLGEPQILGQVKQAFNTAREANSTAQTLEKLFQKSFSVAKRIRTETNIGTSAVSVAYAAVNLAKHIFSALADTRVLLVGAGETIELVARHLADQSVREILVANRTLSRAQGLADEFGAEIMTLNEIPLHLHKADIVISSTASPLPILGKGLVERALKQRRHQPMLFVDIAVPRDIEEEVGELADAYLYTVDDLQGIIDQNMAARKEAAIQAEAIVKLERDDFIHWQRSLYAVDSIREYRGKAETERDQLLQKALMALQNGEQPEAIMQELAYRLTNKLIHAPTQAMVQAGRLTQHEKLDEIRQTLGLDQKR